MREKKKVAAAEIMGRTKKRENRYEKEEDICFSEKDICFFEKIFGFSKKIYFFRGKDIFLRRLKKKKKERLKEKKRQEEEEVGKRDSRGKLFLAKRISYGGVFGAGNSLRELRFDFFLLEEPGMYAVFSSSLIIH